MAAPSLTIIPGILEEHYEETQYLWSHRQLALRSPNHRFHHVAEFEERMESHVQGLLVGGEAMAQLVSAGLTAEDPLEAFASGYALLRLGEHTALQVLSAFEKAQGPGLRGLTDALCHGPVRSILPQFQALLDTSSAPVALACAEILAFHGFPNPDIYRLNRFLKDDSPGVRRAAWRVAGLVGAAVEPKLYALGMREEQLRGEALLAAAWARQEGVLSFCRMLGAQPAPDRFDVLRMLAILGSSQDLGTIFVCGQTVELGPRRFSILGSYGHPSTMNLILQGIADPDPETAAAAAGAFTKMTGHDISSGRTALLASGAADDFEKEFAEEVTLPDPRKAHDHWEKVKSQLESAVRVCAGCDLARGVAPEQFAEFSMESRWEAYLRGKFQGAWQGNALQLELLQKRP